MARLERIENVSEHRPAAIIGKPANDESGAAAARRAKGDRLIAYFEFWPPSGDGSRPDPPLRHDQQVFEVPWSSGTTMARLVDRAVTGMNATN